VFNYIKSLVGWNCSDVESWSLRVSDYC